jgi:hypothetical protein
MSMTFRMAKATLSFSLSLIVLATSQVLRADDGPDHQATQSRPIPLGVSGGSIHEPVSCDCPEW